MSVNEELAARIEGLQDDYEDLQDEISMTDVTDTLGDIASKIAGLPGKIREVRDQGYAYASYLEQKAQTLNDQWGGIHHQINEAIRDELERVQSQFDEVDALWDRVEAAQQAASEEPLTVKTRKTSLAAAIRATVEESKDDDQADVVNKLAAGFGGRKSGGLGSALSSAASGADNKKESAGGLGAALGGASKKTDSGGSTALDKLAAKAANAKQQASQENVELLVNELEEAMEKTTQAVSDAKDRIQGLYGQVPDNVRQTMNQIRDIETYLERADNATFDWLAGEDIYMVAKAEWKDNNDKPDGFVYVSNQRVIMEQAEKKGGILGFGGKKVEGVLWEAPIGTIDNVSFEKKGMFGGIDLITLRFGSGGPFGEVTLEVKEGIHAEWFANRLKRAVSGEIESERGIEHDPAVVEALANAPTMCSVCGATFDQPLTKGMTQIECTYCGAVTRLGLT